MPNEIGLVSTKYVNISSIVIWSILFVVQQMITISYGDKLFLLLLFHGWMVMLVFFIHYVANILTKTVTATTPYLKEKLLPLSILNVLLLYSYVFFKFHLSTHLKQITLIRNYIMKNILELYNIEYFESWIWKQLFSFFL